MRPQPRTRYATVGRCWACRGRVLAAEAVRITDTVTNPLTGRPARRLAHRGDCEAVVRARLGLDHLSDERG